jgi:hypothetical protein
LGCPIIILPVYGSPDSRTLPGEGIINEVLEVFGEALNKSRKPCLKRESSEAQRGAAEVSLKHHQWELPTD